MPALLHKAIRSIDGEGLAVNTDFNFVDDYLNDTDRALIARVRSFVEKDVAPFINEYWEKAALGWHRD